MKDFADEFKADAVALYESTPGPTYKSIAAGLGIKRATPREWVVRDRARRGVTAASAQAAARPAAVPSADPDERVRRLEARVAEGPSLAKVDMRGRPAVIIGYGAPVLGRGSESCDAANMNRLVNEQSPYLLQHATNPVDWWPWGEEAMEEAKRRDVPILLSVGYASCHLCFYEFTGATSWPTSPSRIRRPRTS